YPVGVRDMPAARRLIERDAETYIAGGRYRRAPLGNFGNSAGQFIAAVMPADQRHRDRAVLGHRDYRPLLPLYREEGRHRADQDSAGADADDRPARFEQPADMRRRAIVALVPVTGMGLWPMQPSAGERRPQAAAEGGTARAEHDDGNVLGQ